MNIHRSDLEKILDTLEANATFHHARDRMNGAVHLAHETRWSPLTSETFATRDRLAALLASSKEK